MNASARLGQFVRFAAAGALGALAHYALLLALVEGAGAGPVTGSVAGFALGAVVNYALARAVVFRSGRTHAEALPRFFAVAGVGLLFNGLLMRLLTHAVGMHYLLAQVLTTGLLLLWHYAGNALWTFGRKAPATPR
jgi:putative flippase GtrA